jgi:hypothetical protein
VRSEYLASEFSGAGDVPSRVMCELGAFTLDMALGTDRKADPLPTGDIALSILAAPTLATAHTVRPSAPAVLAVSLE